MTIINNMGIVDIVLIVILAIAILIGLKKGVAGIFFGFIGFLVLGIGVGFLVKFTAPLIVFSDVEQEIHSSIGEKIYDPVFGAMPAEGAIGDLLFTPIIVEEGNVSFDTTITSGEEVITNPTLTEALTVLLMLPEPAISVIHGFVAPLAKDGSTFAIILSNMLTVYAVSTVLWFVLVLILTIVKNIIRKRVFRWLDKNKTASKVDRGLGAAVVTLLIVCLIWGAGLVLELQEDAGNEIAISVNDYINDETLIIKELNNSNLFIMIAKGDASQETSPVE